MLSKRLVATTHSVGTTRIFSDLVDVACGSPSNMLWLVRPDGYLAAAGRVDVRAYLDSICS